MWFWGRLVPLGNEHPSVKLCSGTRVALLNKEAGGCQARGAPEECLVAAICCRQDVMVNQKQISLWCTEPKAKPKAKRVCFPMMDLSVMMRSGSYNNCIAFCTLYLLPYSLYSLRPCSALQNPGNGGNFESTQRCQLLHYNTCYVQ